MTDRLLYALAIPESVQTSTSQELRRQTARQGRLGSAPGIATSISLEPGQQLVTGHYAGQFADIAAAEVEELFDAGGIEKVPYAGRSDGTLADGYYVLSDVTTESPDPTVDRFQRFDGTLSRSGSRRTHWRAVRMNPTPIDTPFGSANMADVGLSVRASKVRWFDDVGGGLEEATPQRRVPGEHDDIDIYDATEPSFDAPTLIYTIPYTAEWPTDCRVWDTYGRSKVYRETTAAEYVVGSSNVGTATVTDTVSVEVPSQWQRVFTTDHDYQGEAVLETDRLRLTIDSGDRLRAYRWREGQYDRVNLGSSPWRLWDVDITHIGLARIGAQFTFSDGTARYAINGTLVRGLDSVVWSEAQNEGSAPQGLVDRLDPIAASTALDPTPDDDIVEKREVDR